MRTDVKRTRTIEISSYAQPDDRWVIHRGGVWVDEMLVHPPAAAAIEAGRERFRSMHEEQSRRLERWDADCRAAVERTLRAGSMTESIEEGSDDTRDCYDVEGWFRHRLAGTFVRHGTLYKGNLIPIIRNPPDNRSLIAETLSVLSTPDRQRHSSWCRETGRYFWGRVWVRCGLPAEPKPLDVARLGTQEARFAFACAKLLAVRDSICATTRAPRTSAGVAGVRQATLDHLGLLPTYRREGRTVWKSDGPFIDELKRVVEKDLVRRGLLPCPLPFPEFIPDDDELIVLHILAARPLRRMHLNSILDASRKANGAKDTATISRILQRLIESGLVQAVGKRSGYCITEPGERFVFQYRTTHPR